MASKRDVEPLDPVTVIKLPRLEQDPSASSPKGRCKPGFKNHFNYKGSYFACPLKTPNGPKLLRVHQSPAPPYVRYGTGAGSQPVLVEGPGVCCRPNPTESMGPGLQPVLSDETGRDRLMLEPVVAREKWGSAGPGHPFLMKHLAAVNRAPGLAVPRPMYRAPVYFMDLRVAQPLQQRPGNADWALPTASHPFHPGEHRRHPYADPSLPPLHPSMALPARDKVGSSATFSPYYAAFEQYRSPPPSPFLDTGPHSQRKVPEMQRLSPDPWHKLCAPVTSSLYQERPPECYPSLHKAPLLFPPQGPHMEAQPCAYRGFGFEGSREPYPGTYLKPQAPWKYCPNPSNTCVPRATSTSMVASPPLKPAALPRDVEPSRQEGYVLSSSFAFSPGVTAVSSPSRACMELGCEQHEAEGPCWPVVVWPSSAFQPVCTQEKVPRGSGGISEAFPKGERCLEKQEPANPERRVSLAPQQGPVALITIGEGDTRNMKDAAKNLISPPPAFLPEGLEDPRDGEVPPPSPPMPVINKVFSLASHGDSLEGTEGSATFCREHLWGDTAPLNMGGSWNPIAAVPTEAGQAFVHSVVEQSQGESRHRKRPEEPEPEPDPDPDPDPAPQDLGSEEVSSEEEALDLSVKKPVEPRQSPGVLRGEGGGKEEEKDAERKVGVGTKLQMEPLLARHFSWDKSSIWSSASFMTQKYKILLSPSAASSTVPAPSSTIPTPSSTVPAPSSTIPAPSSTIPAPSSTIPALYSTIPAPSSTVPAPSSTIPAPSSTIPAPPSTVPAPSSTVPAPSRTIPTPSSTIPALASTMPALSSTIPALSSTTPTPSSIILSPSSTTAAPSSTTAAPSSTIPAPSSIMPSLSSIVPALCGTTPAPSSTIPALSSTIPAPSSTIPAPSSNIPSPSSTIPAVSSTIPALSSTIPTPSSIILSPSSTTAAPSSIVPSLSSIVPALCGTTPTASSTIPALSSTIPSLSRIIPALSSTISSPSGTIPAPSSTLPALSSTISSPSSTIPAPSSTIPALSSIIPSPSSTLPALSSIIPSPSSTTSAPFSTIPAVSCTTPALFSIIPAPSNTISALSRILPALSTTILTPSSIIPSPSRTIPAPSSTIPALSSTIPAPSSTVPAPSSTMPALASIIPAPSSTMPAPSSTIPAPSSTIPALSSTMPALSSTIPALSSTMPALSSTIPAPSSTTPAPSSTMPALSSSIPALSSTVPSPPGSPQRSPAPPCSSSSPASPQPSPLALPERPCAALGEERLSLPSAGQYFATLHAWICDLLTGSVANSSPQVLREWLKKAELVEEQGEAVLKSPLKAKNGSRVPEHHKAAKGKEIWLAFQDVPALLSNLLSQLETFMFARKCPFPHVVRAGAVFIPIHVVKEKLFPKLPGISIDQVLQEHKVELRPTTLSEERHLRDLELKSCTLRMLKLLALKQLPDIYPDLLNLHWRNSIKRQLSSSSKAAKNPSK